MKKFIFLKFFLFFFLSNFCLAQTSFKFSLIDSLSFPKYNEVSGFELGLIVKAEKIKGLMLNFLFSRINEGKGLIISPVSFNKNFSGINLGAININYGIFKGMKIGVFNIDYGEIKGFILGGVNISNKMNGVQIGGINIANDMNGVEIGVLNIATCDRWLVQIGLFNSILNIQFIVKGCPIVLWAF